MNTFTRALVIGASGGIGGAIAQHLDAPARLSRREDGFDITDEASIASAAKRFAGREFDLIFVATGVLASEGGRPEKAFAEFDPESFHRIITVNAVGPALVVKHFAPLLARNGPAVLGFLSARVGSIGDNRLGGWMSYRASTAALNQIVRCASVEIARARPEAVVLALHPGTIETALTRDHARGRYTATPDECAAQLLSVCASATPAMSGGFYAYDGAPIVW